MNKAWIPILIVPCLLGGCKTAAPPDPFASPPMLVGQMTAQEQLREDLLEAGGHWTLDLSRTVLPKGLDNIQASQISLDIEDDYKCTFGVTGNFKKGTWSVGPKGDDRKITLTESTPGSKPVHLTIQRDHSLTLDEPAGELPAGTIFVQKGQP